MTRRVLLFCVVLWACAATTNAQVSSKTGEPSADSLKKFQRLLQTNDTTRLKAYDHLLGRGADADAEPFRAHLALLAREGRDSIVLRWAPSKPGGWLSANKRGYVLDRVTLDASGRAVKGTLRQMTTAPIRPWPLDEWKARAQRINRFAGIAAQGLYGKAFTTKNSAVGSGAGIREAGDELSGRYGFSLFAADNDPLAAEGLGLRFVDRSVTPGSQYAYRVYPAGKDPEYRLDSAFAIVSAIAAAKTAAPPGLTAEGRDRAIILHWKNAPVRIGYSAYNIYRSDDDGASFHQLNADPVVGLTPERMSASVDPTYVDTTIINYRRYIYRVAGITPFAELSLPATVEAMGRSLHPPPQPILGQPDQVGATSMRIRWEYPDTVRVLAGFVVARSESSLTGYHPISLVGNPGKTEVGENLEDFAVLAKRMLPKTARSFVDPAATSDEPFYVVSAIDTAGNVAQSLPGFSVLIDSLPPAAPTGLAGTIDTLGVVRLHWHLGPEPNIIGYRVLWANDPSHEFTQRTGRPVKDTVYTDSIDVMTLTRRVFYRIAAVNSRYAHSPLSPILALTRPDRVPPSPSVFTQVIVSDSSVTLGWARSTAPDLEGQILYRRKQGETQWAQVAKFGRIEESFIDRSVVRRVTYEYQLEAVDSSGLHSAPAMPVSARPYDSGVRPRVTGVEAVHDSAKGENVVHWKYTTPLKGKFWFVIYRDVNGKGLLQFASVEGAVRRFEDHESHGKGTVRYAVKVMTDDGGESLMSESASVTVK